MEHFKIVDYQDLCQAKIILLFNRRGHQYYLILGMGKMVLWGVCEVREDTKWQV
jgi:hypothetical protein